MFHKVNFVKVIQGIQKKSRPKKKKICVSPAHETHYVKKT